MFFLLLNELGLLPSNELADRTEELLASFFFAPSVLWCAVTLRLLRKRNVHSVPDVQLFGVFINPLWAVCFFSFHLSAAFCCRSLFPSVSPLPPPPSRLALKTSRCGCLQTQSTHRHYPHACKSLSLIIGPYCTPTNLPTQHGVVAFSTALSHYLRRHQRGRAFGDIRHSPSVRGPGGLLAELTGD